MTQRLHVGTRKGLFTLQRRDGRWSVAKVDFLGDPVTMLLRDPRDGNLYAAKTLGHFGAKLHRSSDDGATWEEIAVPVYPKGEEVPQPMPDPAGEPPPAKPASLVEIWTLEAGGPDEPGALWAGTIPGGLFRSSDRGASWELVRSLWDRPERREWFGGGKDLPGIHSVWVDPRDSRRVTVGVSCGGVWVTQDRGQTWTCRGDGLRAEYMPPERQGDPNIQDVHRVVGCRTRPEALWAQHHNGIFRTTDGGHSWQEIDGETSGLPAVFGFAAAVHPENPDVAWFVPGIKDECRVPVDARLVVTRTRDGGRTFETLTGGLPQEHAYDLVYRHALDVDATGDALAFGSTTGSLWVSENAGDAWECVSTHLPPVYCVRFAAL